MTSPFELFKADESLEKQGVNIDYGTFAFTVARAGGENEKYKRVMKKLFAPHRRALQTETIADEMVDKIMIEGFVVGCLLGWRCDKHGEGKMEGPKGEAIEFSKDNAISLLTTLPDLFRDLQEQAGKLANFRAATVEDDAGN
jgi:hypothetical protein